MMKELSIEQRIQRLEDIECIKNLTSKYAHFTNQGWNNEVVEVHRIHEIFSEDAVWESTDMNIKETGLSQIEKSIQSETIHLQFAMHAYLNPDIDVNGNIARGKWLFWVISKQDSSSLNQVFMSQDIEYINTSKGWRINAVRLHFGYIIKNK